jgi:hypothetical protein
MVRVCCFVTGFVNWFDGFVNFFGKILCVRICVFDGKENLALCEIFVIVWEL